MWSFLVPPIESTPSTQPWVSERHAARRNQGSLGRWLVPGLKHNRSAELKWVLNRDCDQGRCEHQLFGHMGGKHCTWDLKQAVLQTKLTGTSNCANSPDTFI